jgi:hypothetical protein
MFVCWQVFEPMHAEIHTMLPALGALLIIPLPCFDYRLIQQNTMTFLTVGR